MKDASPLQNLLDTLPRNGTLQWIGVRPARTHPMTVLEEALAEEQRGLAGDRFAGRKDSLSTRGCAIRAAKWSACLGPAGTTPCAATGASQRGLSQGAHCGWAMPLFTQDLVPWRSFTGVHDFPLPAQRPQRVLIVCSAAYRFGSAHLGIGVKSGSIHPVTNAATDSFEPKNRSSQATQLDDQKRLDAGRRKTDRATRDGKRVHS